jgi:hypothetical protein
MRFNSFICRSRARPGKCSPLQHIGQHRLVSTAGDLATGSNWRSATAQPTSRSSRAVHDLAGSIVAVALLSAVAIMVAAARRRSTAAVIA